MLNLNPMLLLRSLVFFALSFSGCEDDKVSHECGGRQVIENFNNKYLRFLITDARPTEAVASFIHLDSVSKVITEYQSCILHDYNKLEHMKVIRASGKVFKEKVTDSQRQIQVDDYDIVDYCTPPFEIKDGEFALENRRDVFTLQTFDTLLQVPCEAYPDGAYVTIRNGEVSGSTGMNGFAGKLNVTSATEFHLDNISLGLFAGTGAQSTFEERFFECLQSNTTLYYTIEKNILLIENPKNGSSIKLILL